MEREQLEFSKEENSSLRKLDDSYISKKPQRSSSEARNLNLCDLTEPAVGEERRVLVLYTGGTIGMVRNKDNVLVPSPGVIENKVRSYPNMHDKEYAKGRFRAPNTSALVLPLTEMDNTRIIYTVYEYLPLLDSSNMTMDDWIRIAKDIKQAYSWFDGFVILHGTDTMAYTAAALSFMLENLGKSVIITGSQIPIFETRSDGRDNFIVGLILAGLHTIPEVTVYFNHGLYRGNRTTKLSTCKLSAFGSPNMTPLATVGIDIQVDKRAIFRPTSISKFEVHTTLCRHVGLLRIFPSITTETVRGFLQPPMKGIVLQSYGAGNIPSNRKDLLEALSEASARGVVIVNCTQCSEGAVKPVYETGRTLLDIGVIPGADMTPEAALTKLAYVLSKDEWSIDAKRSMMRKNLRGEMTRHGESDVETEEQDLISSIAQQMNLSSHAELERLRETLYPSLLCSAVQEDSIEHVEQLLKHGADVNGMDYDNRTALHVAACEGHIPLLTFLLQQGASVHLRDRNGSTPLQQAILFQHLECVQLLVDCGAHLVLPPVTLGEQLCSAALAGRMTTLEGYFLANADPNQADNTGRTPLHMAALAGNLDVCRLLISNGASADVQDLLGTTPAQCARAVGNYGVQRLLERHVVGSSSSAGRRGSSGLSAFVSDKFDLDRAGQSVAESQRRERKKSLCAAGQQRAVSSLGNSEDSSEGRPKATRSLSASPTCSEEVSN